MTSTTPRTVLAIGEDARLGYLLQRYAERDGYRLTTRQSLVPAEELATLQPVFIIFLSLELLETAQELLAPATEIPIVTCVSASGEARAKELGADHCLLHPLTYADFQAALKGLAAGSGSPPT